jgi:hypothetical protein
MHFPFGLFYRELIKSKFLKSIPNSLRTIGKFGSTYSLQTFLFFSLDLSNLIFSLDLPQLPSNFPFKVKLKDHKVKT